MRKHTELNSNPTFSIFSPLVPTQDIQCRTACNVAPPATPHHLDQGNPFSQITVDFNQKMIIPISEVLPISASTST